MHLQLQACKQRCKQTPKMHKRPLSTSFLGSDMMTVVLNTVQHKILMGKILTNLTNFQQFVNIFPIKTFHLVSYLYEMNEYIGIRQFFTRQTFLNPNLSKFSTVKNLRHTVYIANEVQKFNNSPLLKVISFTY